MPSLLWQEEMFGLHVNGSPGAPPNTLGVTHPPQEQCPCTEGALLIYFTGKRAKELTKFLSRDQGLPSSMDNLLLSVFLAFY